MIPYLIAFFGVMLFDALYVVYTHLLVSGKIHQTALIGGLMTMLQGLLVVQYAHNPYIVITAGMGGFIGTYIGNYIGLLWKNHD